MDLEEGAFGRGQKHLEKNVTNINSRTMPMQRFLILFVIATLTFVGLAQAEVITATGKGRTPESAVENALQKAVEMAIVQIVGEEIFIKNKAGIANAIKGKNYVGRWRQGEEEFTGAAYVIAVDADVDVRAIEQDINALGLLQEALGNPRIMVLYNPNLPRGGKIDLGPRDLQAFFDNSYGSIIDVLVENGLEVVDKRASEGFSIQLADTHDIDVDLNRASAYGLKYHADLILYYQTVGIVGHGAAKMFLRAQLINPTNARIIASKKVEHVSEGISIHDALYSAADQVGRQIAGLMIDSIKKHWRKAKSTGRTFIVVMDGVEDAEQIMSFKDRLESCPELRSVKEVESGGGKTTYEVKYTGNRDDIDVLVMEATRELGWTVKRIRAEGNRSTWKKE